MHTLLCVYRGYQGVGGQVLLEIAWLLPKRPHARIMQGPKVHQTRVNPTPLNTPGPISCVIVFPVSSFHFEGHYRKRITYFVFAHKKQKQKKWQQKKRAQVHVTKFTTLLLLCHTTWITTSKFTITNFLKGKLLHDTAMTFHINV